MGKSSAVPLYLAEHPNRLVTHTELQHAVWPGTAVSPSVLRVSIREIRAGLALSEQAVGLVRHLDHPLTLANVLLHAVPRDRAATGDNLFALRTAMDLARLSQDREKCDEARALPAPLHASFTQR